MFTFDDECVRLTTWGVLAIGLQVAIVLGATVYSLRSKWTAVSMLIVLSIAVPVLWLNGYPVFSLLSGERGCLDLLKLHRIGYLFAAQIVLFVPVATLASEILSNRRRALWTLLVVQTIFLGATFALKLEVDDLLGPYLAPAQSSPAGGYNTATPGLIPREFGQDAMPGSEIPQYDPYGQPMPGWGVPSSPDAPRPGPVNRSLDFYPTHDAHQTITPELVVGA